MYRMRRTSPAIGERFMWTLKIERKIPITIPGPPNSSTCSTSCMSTTLPSAGETTTPGPSGIFRSGSRKNQTISPPQTTPVAQNSHRMIVVALMSGRFQASKPLMIAKPNQKPAIRMSSARPTRANGSVSRQRNGVVVIVPFVARLVLIVLHVARIVDLVRTGIVLSPSHDPHLIDVLLSKLAEIPPSQSSPGQPPETSRSRHRAECLSPPGPSGVSPSAGSSGSALGGLGMTGLVYQAEAGRSVPE